MKTTAFKVFALWVVVICFASSSMSKGLGLFKMPWATTENPADENPSIIHLLKSPVLLQSNVDIKPYDSKLIANEVVQNPSMMLYAPLVSQRKYPQRLSYVSGLKNQQEDDESSASVSVSVDSKETVSELPDPSNEVGSQEANDVSNSQHSHKHLDSQQSKERDSSQSEPSESNDSDDIYKSEEKSDDSANSEDDKKQKYITHPPFLKTTF